MPFTIDGRYARYLADLKELCRREKHSLKDPPDEILFAFNIIRLRRERAVLQVDLSKKCGVSSLIFQQIGNGTYNVKLSEENRIAKALGVRVRDLFAPVDLSVL